MGSVELSISSSSGDMACVDSDADGTLTDGEQDLFYCTPDFTLSHGAYSGILSLAYTNQQTALNHTKIGEIRAFVE
jgi:hypothetical protein